VASLELAIIMLTLTEHSVRTKWVIFDGL